MKRIKKLYIFKVRAKQHRLDSQQFNYAFVFAENAKKARSLIRGAIYCIDSISSLETTEFDDGYDIIIESIKEKFTKNAYHGHKIFLEDRFQGDTIGMILHTSSINCVYNVTNIAFYKHLNPPIPITIKGNRPPQKGKSSFWDEMKGMLPFF